MRTQLWMVMLVAPLALGACKKKVKTDVPVGTIPAGVQVEETPGEPASARVDRAVALLTTGSRDDAAKARDLLVKVTEAEPDNVAAHLNLGVAWYTLGNPDAAAMSFARVTRTRPDLADGWRYLGLTEVALGDPDAGLRHLRQGLDVAPGDADLRVALVSTLRVLGRNDEAIAAATEALRLNARSLPIYDEMGLAWIGKGDIDRARFVYEKASTITGAENNPAIQAGFGWILLQKGERYAAEARLKRALELDPQNLRALVALSSLYAEDHNWAGALELLERAARVDPRNHGVQVELGRSLRGVGRLDDAEAAWRRALALDPKDPTPYFNLGVLNGDDRKQPVAGIADLKAYLAGGGTEAVLAQSYIDGFQKETERSALRRKQEEEKARRDQERQERERLLKEAERAPKPAEPPAPEPSPGSPWGQVGEEGGGTP